LRRVFVATVAALLVAQASARAQRLPYPTARESDVVEDYHGTRVPDPYRWLEDLDGAETTAWVKAENVVTFAYLDRIAVRDWLKTRLTELWNTPRTSVPFTEAGRLFYTKNTGLQRQSVWFTRPSLTAAERVVIDPNEISPDGSQALSGFYPSLDGRYVAYSLSEGGADWQTFYVRDLATGRQLSDTLRWTKFTGASWTKDGRGFFYSRYPEPSGEKIAQDLTDARIYYHVAGTPQAADQLIYERPDLAGWFLGASTTEDGHYLMIYVSSGATVKNRLYYADLGDPMRPNVSATVRPVEETGDWEISPLGNVGAAIVVRTDAGAPKRKLVRIELADPAPDRWVTLVPESPHVMEGAALTKSRIVVEYLEDVKSVVRLFSLDGKSAGRIELPGLGTLAGLSTHQDSDDLFYGFASALVPNTSLHWNAATGGSTPFEPPPSSFDASPYETRQVFYQSKDGTRVPMFITARKNLALDGTNPTMLYGYGGFSISETPVYRREVLAWLELGGVYALANLRGGAEYGEVWHEAGMLEKKQNVFDDFIAAAEYLVREKYTSTDKLAINGGSNGGLLVGAVMAQRPDLFAVAVPDVGVLDMLRYHRFSAGRFWVTEYGSADNPAQFPFLLKYSPLHNLKRGTCYPATFITTADHDDRVVPSHSFKFAATLQAAQGCDRPTLIRIEALGSHGYVPTDKRIQAAADKWSFVAENLAVRGVPVP
ncbi:MAG TPA: prolyl oligopeptidase family serine peptidase, partial [Thermoleophilia bacterium]|nr:prolyl oligopeptidase family serine peptidase [Thermoleophilia bacterium]